MKKGPLISCLCVSENRPEQLKNAISYFKQQTYENKELIILSRNFDPIYDSLIKFQKKESIKYYWLTRYDHFKLGDLRNFLIEKATGEYWCVWDDDDWYHIRRLEVQFKELVASKKDAVILSYNLMFDARSNEAYMSQPLNMPGTLLCKRNDLRYPSTDVKEDVEFLRKVYAQNILFPLVKPTLYIYVYHGSNTSDAKNFNFIFKDSQKLSGDGSKRISEVVRNKYSYQKSCRMMDQSEVLSELDYFKSLEFFKQ